MRGFFELAESKGFLGPSGVAGLSQRKSRLLDFTIEAAFSLPMQRHGINPGFGYVANTPTSGGFFPCSELECRFQHADRLARFAALYADHVVIHNPFTNYSPRLPVDIVRQRLAGDLIVLNHLRPLIDRGIVTAVAPAIPLCESCSRRFGEESEALRRSLDDTLDLLLERYMQKLRFTRDGTDKVLIEGPPELVTHGSQVYIIPRSSSYYGRLTPKKKRRLAATLITPLLEDVYTHQMHSRHTSLNYLTDRELDLAIVRAMGSKALRQIDSAITRGLSHAVPVVANIPIEDVLLLRDAEPEAFQVYRNALSRIVREANLSSPEAIEDAFQSQIAPELARLDMSVRNARKVARRQLTTEALVTTVAVSIGLLLGTVEPVAGAVLVALGGLEAMKSAGQKLVDSVAEPAIVRENSFYFLWRMKQPRRVPRLSVRR
jgi:hypothetical protein